jgi:hypothetical protein
MWGTLSVTRGRVCRLQLVLVLASAVILGSESRGTCDYILLSQIRDVNFRRLLRVAGLRWRYPTPPPHGIAYPGFSRPSYNALHGPSGKHRFQQYLYFVRILCRGNVFTEPFSRNGCTRYSIYSAPSSKRKGRNQVLRWFKPLVLNLCQTAAR